MQSSFQIIAQDVICGKLIIRSVHASTGMLTDTLVGSRVAAAWFGK